MTRLRGRLEPFAIPFAVLVLWEGAGAIGVLPDYLSRPSAIGAQLWDLVRTGEIVGHIAISLYRSLAGFALGALIGVALGLLSGTVRQVEGFVDPLVALGNPVPKIALLPVLIVWFGISDTSKIVLIAITTFFPCFLAARSGVRGVRQSWLWAGRNMGANGRTMILKVILPAALPQIFGGLRVALALAFILMFASEAVGTAHRAGLGFLIIIAEAGGRHDLMLAAIAIIAALGFAADRVLAAIERTLVPSVA